MRNALTDVPAPTIRLVVFALAMALPLALGSLAPFLVGVALAGGVALIGIVLADFAAATAPCELDLERRHEPRLYLDADNPVDLVVTNRSRRDLHVRLRDTPPPPFRTSCLFSAGAAPAAAKTTFRYTTRPTSRGRYRFGVAVLRWRTPLGLLWRQRTYPLAGDIAVYPNLIEVQKYDLLARRGQLAEMGLRRARQLGRGGEFESMRDYVPNDDFRRINWKATARRHRPITTLYETERSQRLVVALDLGRLMLTRVGDLSRLDYAVNAAVLLSHVALARGDRVGLLAFGERVASYARPARGRRQFYQILEQLAAVRAAPLEADYAAAFTHLRSDLQGRSLVVLFTDLSDPTSARLVARRLAALARRHLPVCVTLRDSALADRARALPESGFQVYEKVVAGQLLEERAAILDALRRHGVLTVDVPADSLTLATINRYLELKDRALL